MTGIANRVRVFTATTGTSTMSLGAAYGGSYLSATDAALVNGREYVWLIEQGSDFELVRGIYTASGGTAARTTVLVSKIANAVGTSKLNLNGTAIVSIVHAAEEMLQASNNLSELADFAAARTNLGLGTAANPQFATIELGHATDTTVSRPAAGRLQVEGKEVLSTKDLSTTLSAADQAQLRANISAALKGHLFGLTMSNNATDSVNDIDIAAGEAASTEANPALMVLASALTKRLDANWAVGNNQGGLDSGSIADVVYHVWLIQRSDTGVVDALFSMSATAPTMPANYDRKRRIGAIIRASATIRGFVQDNDKFILKTPVQIANGANLTTTSQLFQLAVPTGISVEAEVNALIFGSASISTLIQSPLIAAQTANAPAGNISLINVAGSSAAGQFRITTDTSGNIRAVSNVASGANFYLIETGWIDRRDRF